ncbi:MAG: bacteriochlorophyll/chlorophyll a synthase, partial [Gemmatimonadota bacterium]
MVVARIAVIGLLLAWGRPVHGAAVAALLVIQVPMMARFLGQPRERALWYSGFGVPLYVLGMMASAIAVRGLEIL